MGFPLRIRELGPWVAGYAILGLVPRFVLPYFPAEMLDSVVASHGDRTLKMADVAMWLPNVFLFAAALTLLVGVVFAVGNWWVNLLTHEGTRYGWIHSLFQQVRYSASIAGILIIVVSIVMVWISIFQDDLLHWIDLIVLGIAAGTSLATGAAYYR